MAEKDNWPARQRIGLMAGPLVLIAIYVMPLPDGMSPAARATLAITALMAIWWISEAIPIAATALVPIALFAPLGVMDARDVTRAYGNHLIFLFLGGFLIALAMERWRLHRRIALKTLQLVGVSPRRIVLGFMLATAFLSMWISNTAAAMLMVTIGLAVLAQSGDPADDDTGNEAMKKTGFGTTLMLGIAYAASIGGVATLIGSPPNAIFAGVLESTHGTTISFAKWMALGLPLAVVMLAITWFYLTRRMNPDTNALKGGKEIVAQQLRELGPASREEIYVAIVFVTVALLWLARGFTSFGPLGDVQDSTIAIAGGLALFMIPSHRARGEFLLNWQTAVKLPWDVIILFGGGFALAQGFTESGLTNWLGERLTVLDGVPTLGVIAAIAFVVVFLTEVTSNTATASLLLPLMGALAGAIGQQPESLMVAVALGASFAFMLPVATPPNAIVFGSRAVTIPQMARVGFWLNLVGIALITATVYLVLPLVWR